MTFTVQHLNRDSISFLAALALHSLAWVSLPASGALFNSNDTEKTNTVDLELSEAPIEESELAGPEPPPTEMRPPPEEPPKAVRKSRKKPTFAKEPPAAATETPLDFDNIVLTHSSATKSQWATDEASGKESLNPVGSPTGAVTGRSLQGVDGGVLGGTGTGIVTEVGDLSRMARPPSLRRLLERNFPKQARSDSVQGDALVRLTIGVNGRVHELVVVRESPKGYGFGKACTRTLRKSKWKPALDKSGRAVSTRPTFSCRFELR